MLGMQKNDWRHVYMMHVGSRESTHWNVHADVSSKCCCVSQEKLVWKVWQVELVTAYMKRMHTSLRVDWHEPTCIVNTWLKAQSRVYFDETLLWFGFTFVSLFTASPLTRSVNSSLLPPLYPHCSTSISHLQEVGDVTVLTSTSRLPLLYIQKNCVISLLFLRKK
jgi:hypothetical protein